MNNLFEESLNSFSNKETYFPNLISFYINLSFNKKINDKSLKNLNEFFLLNNSLIFIGIEAVDT